MIDFPALLDRVIARETRGNFATFLATYEHVEFGHASRLTSEEAMLVLTTLDSFLITDSLATLQIPELRELYARLSMHATQESVISTEDHWRIRNACFDALACLKALEARVCGLLDGAAARRLRLAPSPPVANDL